MKFWRACVLFLVAAVTQAQTPPKPAEPAQRPPSLADFGLVYPLSNDWVRATEMLRKKVESSSSPQSFDVLLAAVYVPNSNMSATNPYFSLLAYRQPANDCKKNLEAMIANTQEAKTKLNRDVVEFSAGGRSFFRVDMAHGSWARHQSIICTAANKHLLIWNAGANDEKGLDAILETLNSVASASAASTPEPAQPAAPKPSEAAMSETPPAPPQKVRVSRGVTTGLLIKKVAPDYPEVARRARIQGVVVLKAEISKTGDIADLELLDGPIELAGSAVAAVRQWKYRPYLLMGQPVTVETQIQVNYQLAGY